MDLMNLRINLSITFLLLFAALVQGQNTTTEWVMYPWQIDHSTTMSVVDNDSEILTIAGDGIEISLLHFNESTSQGRSLKEFSSDVKQMFLLEDPDPIYPFPSEHLTGMCIGGYKDLSRIVIIAFDGTEGRFLATAIFDDDDLDAEKQATEILKSLRPVPQ